jgi:hypothetical protein
MADLNNDFDKFLNCCIVMILGTITAASLGTFFRKVCYRLDKTH